MFINFINKCFRENISNIQYIRYNNTVQYFTLKTVISFLYVIQNYKIDIGSTGINDTMTARITVTDRAATKQP